MLQPDSRRGQEAKVSGAVILFCAAFYLLCKRGRSFLSDSLLG